MRDLTMGAPGLSRAKSVADGFSDAVLADASPRLLAGLVLLALAASAGLGLMPAYPIGAQLNDFFLLVDWIHRWGAGQVPHRDYHAPLGFLATAPAALGFALTGDVGRALRLADIAALAALTGPFLVAARGRLSNGLATIAFAVVAALTLTPLDLFNLLPFPSAAMTYNRVGWAALLVAALFLVPARRPAERPTSALDLAMLAWLALLGLYLKATYGLALGAIGLLYLALHRPPARALLPAVVLALGGIGLVEAMFGLNRAYLADLAFAAGVDGAGRMGPARVLFALTASGGDVLLGALVPVAVALAAGRRALAAAIAVLLALAVAVMLQNAQASGLPLLIAGAVIAAAVVDRAGWGRPARLLALALPLAAAAPTLDLALRTWDGTARALAKPGALTGTALPGLATLRVPGEPGFPLVARAAAGGLDARTYVAEAARLAPTGLRTTGSPTRSRCWPPPATSCRRAGSAGAAP